MIIHDTSNHKIDIEFVESQPPNINEPKWLQITTFHRKGTDWDTEIIRMSRKATLDMISFLDNEMKTYDYTSI